MLRSSFASLRDAVLDDADRSVRDILGPVSSKRSPAIVRPGRRSGSDSGGGAVPNVIIYSPQYGRGSERDREREERPRSTQSTSQRLRSAARDLRSAASSSREGQQSLSASGGDSKRSGGGKGGAGSDAGEALDAGAESQLLAASAGPSTTSAAAAGGAGEVDSDDDALSARARETRKLRDLLKSSRQASFRVLPSAAIAA